VPAEPAAARAHLRFAGARVGERREPRGGLTGAPGGRKLGEPRRDPRALGRLEQAVELAQVVARRPPIAVRLGKQAVLAAEETTLTTGVEYERRLYEQTMATEDRLEGMSAFIEKRKPDFKGR
jgi:hypothetical protein